MLSITRQVSIFLLIGFITACGTTTNSPIVDKQAIIEETRKQRALIVNDWLTQHKQLQRVSYPLLINGTTLCYRTTYALTGMTLMNTYMMQPKYRTIALNDYGIDGRVSVIDVVPSSPAALAGIQAGDILTNIGSFTVASDQDAVFNTEAYLHTFLTSTQSKLFRVERLGKSYTLTLTPQKGCADKVLLSINNEINAYADGNNIVVNKGMVEFSRSDEELALVIAHELAHNAMNHLDKKRSSEMWGNLLGGIMDVVSALKGVNTQGVFSDLGSDVGAGTYSVEYEQEADYVGLYLMRLGGYNINNAADFWRRMAVQNNRLITLKNTHPTSVERFLAIEKTIAEIKNKETQGLALQPEFTNE